MSYFEPTYSAYCDAGKPHGKQGYPEWLKRNYEQRIAELESQLAAMDAALAVAKGALNAHEEYCKSPTWCEERAYNHFANLKDKALAALQSSDALVQQDAELRRKAFHDCADFICRMNPWLDRARMQEAIDGELEEIAIESGERRV